MKINKASYMDDGVTIHGVLVERFLRKPVFYTADPSCGWDSQVITKSEESKVIVWAGKGHTGRFRVRGGTEAITQNSDEMYREAIRETLASGKADEILSSEKSQSLNKQIKPGSGSDCFDKNFYNFCYSYICSTDSKSHREYCPIASEVLAKFGIVGREDACKTVFLEYKERAQKILDKGTAE